MKIFSTIMLMLFIISCGSFNEGKGELHYYNTISTGQQLIDLKNALDQKVINRLEFDTLKTRIMSNSINASEIINDLKEK